MAGLGLVPTLFNHHVSHSSMFKVPVPSLSILIMASSSSLSKSNPSFSHIFFSSSKFTSPSPLSASTKALCAIAACSCNSISVLRFVFEAYCTLISPDASKVVASGVVPTSIVIYVCVYTQPPQQTTPLQASKRFEEFNSSRPQNRIMSQVARSRAAADNSSLSRFYTSCQAQYVNFNRPTLEFLEAVLYSIIHAHYCPSGRY